MAGKRPNLDVSQGKITQLKSDNEKLKSAKAILLKQKEEHLGKIEVLESDLRNERNARDELQLSLNIRTEAYTESINRNSELEKQVQDLKNKFQTLQNQQQKNKNKKRDENDKKEAKAAKQDISKLKDAIQTLNKELETKKLAWDIVNQVDTKAILIRELVHKCKLEGNKNIIDNLIMKNAENIDRLAKQLHARYETAKDETKAYLTYYDPLEVVEDYNRLRSSVRPEVKQALNNFGVDYKDAIKFICEVLLVSRKEAGKKYRDLHTTFSRKQSDPLSNSPISGLEGNVSALPDDTSISNATSTIPVTDIDISLLLKEVRSLIHQVKSTLIQRDEFAEYVPIPEVTRYITESVRLAWKMVVQRPAMEFEVKGVGEILDNTRHVELEHVRGQFRENAILQYYASPILLHADKVMARGRVVVNRT